MAFSINNYDELIALHRVVMEAKFSTDPNDPVIQGSPLVSTVANQVVEALIEMEVEKEGEASRLKWQEWRQLSPERREYQIIQAKLKSDFSWKKWNPDEQVKYVRDLASPLQVTDELISNLLN
ncbi:hypothetical protein [Calothrix sp. NIES-3974]|uniref:hypothetical protein n=1 Tax=Calothrix sp. NIES-3974 TaxID=2005462 RepID=UPI000B612C2A|nr:hypothetical protein [Calothrix sp. NIES-3974]BAZ04017.1 hypothetical protein NIES3974_06470 [Calothrix sp. NIES-3974]